jgi:hypothetical protein
MPDQGRPPEPTDTRPRLTYYFPGSPFYRSDGCMIRVLQTLEFLHADWDIDFYSFENYQPWPWRAAHQEELRRLFPRVVLHLDRFGALDRLLLTTKNLACSLAPGRAANIARLRLPGRHHRWQGLRRNRVFFCNYVDALLQLDGVTLAADRRTIIDTHDTAFFGYSARLGTPIHSLPALRKIRKEVGLYALATDLIAISAKESALLADICPLPPAIRFLPPLMSPAPLAAGAPDRCLLFVGSANAKNVVGMERFLAVATGWPQPPPLRIVGKIAAALPPTLLAQCAHFAQPLGFVDDLAAVYGSSWAAICPVDGSGINYKLLEALAHGVPCFATPSAINALPPGWQDCVFDLQEAAIRKFLDDPEARQRASRAALAYVTGPAFTGAWQQLRLSLLADSAR